MKNSLYDEPVEHLDPSECRKYQDFYLPGQDPEGHVQRRTEWRRWIVISAWVGASLVISFFVVRWFR